MSLKEQIFGMTLDQLNLRDVTAREIEYKIFRFKDKENVTEADRAWLRSQITVAQVVFVWRKYKQHHKATSCMRTFIRKLAELGLTRLDWVFMPQSTVTEELLRSMPKAELLTNPMIALPAVSYDLEECICSYLLDYNPRDTDEFLLRQQPTIAQMLALSDNERARPALEAELGQRYWTAVKKVRALLYALGFTAEDGPFMTFGGMGAKLQEELRAKYDLTQDEAVQVVSIARQEGWISQYFTEEG